MIRKYLLLMGVMLSLGTLAKAQSPFPKHDHQDDHTTRFFVGGLVSYWQDTKAKTTSLTLSPEAGYLFTPHWGAGLMLSFDYAKESEEVSRSWSIRPFTRYYYFNREPFNLFLDAGLGFSFQDKKMGFEAGVRPGACIDLTEGLCLCLRLGFAGYRNGFFAGEEEGLTNNGFGLRFAPEELRIGLELEF